MAGEKETDRKNCFRCYLT